MPRALPALDAFADIAVIHRMHEELVLRHQERLLDGDLAGAGRLLEALDATLRGHAAAEDEHLVPVYARVEPPKGGPPELFTGEHTKIVRFLDRTAAHLAGVSGPRDVIALFDLESRMKGLLDHHYRREETLLFPTLDRIATDAERTTGLAAFRDEARRLVDLLG